MSVDLISKLISDDQEDFKWHREKFGLDHWSLDYWTIFLTIFLTIRDGGRANHQYIGRGGM